MMALVTASEIGDFEKQLDAAVQAGHAKGLDVIGYGEITIGVKGEVHQCQVQDTTVGG